jgi:asparagine synthase (glutamine-hydrolysing)
MCGITFRHDPAAGEERLAAATAAALARMRHRGPDEGGSEVRATWAIGNRRLAIIDLPGSRQPLADPSGRFWLSFNGEIYNYRQLEPALAGRWRFRTAGDTEVLLAGLVLDGPGFLDRLEGMWGFALWDARERRLLVARDRMGKKPLYLRADGERFACASELPTLAALTGETWSEDADSAADYFRYGYTLPGTTIWREVRELPPATFATWTPGGGLREERYWTLPIGGWAGSREAARDELRGALQTAVERRLVADVEVGAFLSGGIDSSLVVGLLAGRLGVKPRTFTIGFADASYDERPFARTVARRWGLEHHERAIDTWDRGRLVDLVLGHVGQPFSDSSLLPTAAVSALAAEHLKVALSGDGGDEVFGGYQRYLARALLAWYTALPRPLRRGAESALRALPEPGAHHSRSLLKKAHLFADVAARQGDERPYVAPVMFAARDLAALVPELAGRGHRPPPLPDGARDDALLEMMAGDLLVYLPQDILVKVDRASMACSLEARAPFLDRRVVELAFSLPRRWHRRGFAGKRMLRESFADLLPAEVWRRRKQGFAVPLHAWFRDGLGDELEDLLAGDPGPLAAGEVRRLLAEHRAGRRDHGYRLWMVYVYLLWRRHRPWPAS